MKSESPKSCFVAIARCSSYEVPVFLEHPSLRHVFNSLTFKTICHPREELNHLETLEKSLWNCGCRENARTSGGNVCRRDPPFASNGGVENEWKTIGYLYCVQSLHGDPRGLPVCLTVLRFNLYFENLKQAHHDVVRFLWLSSVI